MAGPKLNEDGDLIDPESAGRFSWGDGDVEWHDGAGEPITARQAKEIQLEAARARVRPEADAE